MQRTRTPVSVPVTATTETTSQTTTTSPPRELVENVGKEVGEDSQLVQMCRIAALMAEREDTISSDAIAEPRRRHLEKLKKVKDAVIKVVPRTDATTRPLTGRWVDTMHDDGAWVRANSGRKRGHLLSNASDDAPQNDVGRGSSERTRCGSRRLRRRLLLTVTFEPRRNRMPSLDRAASRGRAGTRLHLGSRVSIPRNRRCTESEGHVQCELSHEFHGDGMVTIRRLLVLSF